MVLGQFVGAKCDDGGCDCGGDCDRGFLCVPGWVFCDGFWLGHFGLVFALVALVSWAKVQNARARLMQMVGMAIWGRSAAAVAMVIPKTARLV